MIAILKHAWRLYRQHFGIIVAAVVLVWLPLELLSSYMDHFVFDPDDVRRSFKFSQFLDNFIGIIATAAVISIGYSSSLGEQPSFGGAINAGLGAWGRMWWTRFLTGLTLVIGFLLLIVPGVYLMVRLALVESVAVCERVSGSAAMSRSFELTRDRFWPVALLGVAFSAVILAALGVVMLPAIFIPSLDHWLIDAATSLISDVIVAYGTLCLLSAYVVYSNAQDAAGEPLE